MKNLAYLFSFLFHPLFMVTYGCILIFFGLSDTIYFLFTPLKIKLLLIVTVFTFTFLLPLLNLLILYKLNYVSSLMIEERKERTFPLILTALSYFGLYYMLHDFNIWPVIKLFVLGGGICVFCSALINVWWQISAHMVGIGGLFGVLLAIGYFMQTPMLLVISACLLIAGCIGFARLFLNAHTPSQIYVGFLLGSVVQFLLIFLAQTATVI